MKLTWPLTFIAIVTPLTVIITYFIAVLNGHVSSHFPFVSDTFVASPERVIAAIALNTVAFVLVVVIYCRHLQVKSYAKTFDSPVLLPINKASLVIGLFAALGLNILANCPAEDLLLPYHIAGSFLFYLGLAAYMFCESLISLLTPDSVTSRRVTITRILINLANIMCILVMIATGLIAGSRSAMNRDEWNVDRFRVVAAILEWTVLFLLLSFMGTYYRESQSVTINLADLITVEH